MPTDTAPFEVTEARAAAAAAAVSATAANGNSVAAGTVPVIASGPEAVRTAQDFAAWLADGVIERDRSGALPVRELASFDASGLLAITVPRKHGGADVPATVLAEVIRTIAAVDPAIAQGPQGHFLLVDVLSVLGPPDQR